MLSKDEKCYTVLRHALAQCVRRAWRIFRFALKAVFYLAIIALIAVLIFRPTYPFGVGWNAISRVARDDIFNYIDWEIDALSAKVAQTLWGEHPFMDEDARSQYVRDYMADMVRVHQLEGEIAAIYTDPTIETPQEASTDFRAERDHLRDDLSERQSLAEAILEGQVAAILVEVGFGRWGQLLPPISMRFTEMPNMLITSPRDKIMRSTELALDPMPIEAIIALENRIAEEQNISTLIVPLGGMALYPVMIQETSSIPWAVATFAHEWVHHYFFFYPLGLNYFTADAETGREALIINETAADIFGAEVARLILQRYYPEFMIESGDGHIVFISETSQNTFDYGREMHLTRVTVDHMMGIIQTLYTRAETLHSIGLNAKADDTLALAAYYIVKVETYMEARRIYFYENGYRIRRMNQAYFAFYGGYQGGIPGIGGNDPIGPAVAEIREMSDSLHSFILTMRNITTRTKLLAVRDSMRQERPQ